MWSAWALPLPSAHISCIAHLLCIFFSLQTQELLASQKWPAGMFPEEEDGLEDGMHSDHHDRDSATTARSSMTELFKFKKGSECALLIR